MYEGGGSGAEVKKEADVDAGVEIAARRKPRSWGSRVYRAELEGFRHSSPSNRLDPSKALFI